MIAYISASVGAMAPFMLIIVVMLGSFTSTYYVIQYEESEDADQKVLLGKTFLH
jgi:hypothetical protein